MPQDPHELWARCLLKIEQRVRPESFKNWFRPTSARHFDADQLVIQVSSSFLADWVESYYLGLIQKVVQEETGFVPKIGFVVAEEAPIPEGVAPGQPLQLALPPRPAAPRREERPVSLPAEPAKEGKSWYPNLLSTPLNERYTFERFIIGEGNRLAHAAAQAAAKSPGKTQFNPLVIYGGVGLGKTHLLQAIGHYAQLLKTACRVVYVPSEKFMTDFIEAIKTRSAAEFQRFYRSADILLIDDIQFLLKGEHTQTEFFHTFNALHQNAKQIAMTCDSPPGELVGLEERLISRFQWGLVTNIEPPDLETRIAILQQKAEISGIHLPVEVAVFLGNYISSNIRELEGALNHLMAYCAVNQLELCVEAARKLVQDRLPASTSHVSIESIQQVVARHFNLTPGLLIGKTRKQEIVMARQIAMFLAKRLTPNSLKVIGLHFGNRDHSTVIHAVQTVEKKCQQDSLYSRLVEALSDTVQHPPN